MVNNQSTKISAKNVVILPHVGDVDTKATPFNQALQRERLDMMDLFKTALDTAGVEYTAQDQIVSYRATITTGTQLRERGIDIGFEDVMFLYGTNALGAERELCWLEMNDAHGTELDELIESLPRIGVMAVVQAMVARTNSLSNIIEVAKAAKRNR
ncbi:hypothetical protein [Enterobacter sp. Lyrl_3]|uniref:hypothetical protein n=1 Tax=Enterobacter sp. Lyrl_3 TaxID=3110922 RepID=UPI003F7E3D5E